MLRLFVIAVLVLLSIVASCVIGFVLLFGIVSDYGVGVHQRSVTRSLAEWKEEYGNISSHHDAVRTAEMLQYVQDYYVPADGYRSTQEIEAALEKQRKETISAFVAALRHFTGKDFGTDSGQWLKYLKLRQPE